ncbi:hypothetical protein G6L88_21685 [Rhizobium skierniewicense]|nr:hypothetical protein [Rhizobium skierniewicense]
MQRHSDPTMGTPRHPLEALTNLGAKHTPLQAGRPVPCLPRFDQSFIAPSPWPGFPLSSGSVDMRAVVDGGPWRALHFHRAFVCRVRSARRERQSCCRAQMP